VGRCGLAHWPPLRQRRLASAHRRACQNTSLSKTSTECKPHQLPPLDSARPALRLSPWPACTSSSAASLSARTQSRLVTATDGVACGMAPAQQAPRAGEAKRAREPCIGRSWQPDGELSSSTVLPVIQENRGMESDSPAVLHISVNAARISRAASGSALSALLAGVLCAGAGRGDQQCRGALPTLRLAQVLFRLRWVPTGYGEHFLC